MPDSFPYLIAAIVIAHFAVGIGYLMYKMRPTEKGQSEGNESDDGVL